MMLTMNNKNKCKTKSSKRYTLMLMWYSKCDITHTHTHTIELHLCFCIHTPNQTSPHLISQQSWDIKRGTITKLYITMSHALSEERTQVNQRINPAFLGKSAFVQC